MRKNKYSVFSRGADFITYRFDQAVSGPAIKQLLVLLTVFAAVYLIWLILAFSISFFGKEIVLNREIPDLGWSVIAQMIDPGNQHMVGIAAGKDAATGDVDGWSRLFALLLTLSGTFAFGGLLISTITNVFDQRVALVREGMVNYRYEDHLLILGYSPAVHGLIRQLIGRRDYEKYRIVLMTERNVPEVRRILSSEFTRKDMKRIVILFGDRTSANDLNRTHIHLTRRIFILGEENESAHDSKNNACLAKIDRLAENILMNSGKKLNCEVMFDSQTTIAAYQFGDVRTLPSGSGTTANIVINSFSFYENWAQKVFLDRRPVEEAFPPLDFEPITQDSDKYVHLLVAGMTKMGLALGVEAAKLGHFANYSHRKTQITFIDSDADRERDYFATRFQSFYESVDVSYEDLFTGDNYFKTGKLPFINISLRFVKGHFESLPMREKLLDWTSDPDALTTISLCFNNLSANLAAGLFLPNLLYKRKVRVLVRQETSHSVVSLLRPDKEIDNQYRHVKAFGMLNDSFDFSLDTTFKAMAVNYFYWSKNSLPDKFNASDLTKMQEYWDDLPERHKWSNRYNAASIPVKLRAVGADKATAGNLQKYFTNENIALLAELEHARWNVAALLMGYDVPTEQIVAESVRTSNLAWKAYNPGDEHSKDSSYSILKKEHEKFVKSHKIQMIHPCLVAYENLNEYYKDIDRRLVCSIPVIESECEVRNSIYP
jgi:hypothetical protein